ncbi:hypothetical protein K6L09_21130 [Burkholderia cepacia]
MGTKPTRQLFDKFMNDLQNYHAMVSHRWGCFSIEKNNGSISIVMYFQGQRAYSLTSESIPELYATYLSLLNNCPQTPTDLYFKEALTKTILEQ